MKSIISFPDRGPWGDSKWRGNCSGHVIRELIEHYRPRLFVDACEGSGTSGEVCRDLGVEYVGLDIHKGFDFTRDSILKHLPRQADVVFTHPPYWDMIDYRRIGRFDHESLADQDLSACSEEEFLEKSQTMLVNQRVATKGGGIYTTLIGDYRRKGVFRSFQADFIGLMPKEELEAVLAAALMAKKASRRDGQARSQAFFAEVSKNPTWQTLLDKAGIAATDVWAVAQNQLRSEDVEKLGHQGTLF